MFIIHSLHRVGGAETVLSNLINHFSKEMGHHIILTTLTNKDIIFDLDNNIKVIQNKEHTSDNTLINFYKQIIGLKHIIKDNNPDIVISFVTAINIFSIIASKLTSTPIIISERSSYSYGVKNKLWSILRRLVYPFADILILPASEEKNKYHYCKRIHIIPNPLKLKNNHHNITREKIILAVGTLHHAKGFDILINAFKKVNQNDWKLIILGRGRAAPALEEQIHKLKLTNKVYLLGQTQDTEQYYRKASIFVLSSRTEGYPNVLCEAMGYGCPPISFDCISGPKDIISNGEDGILVEAENMEELSNAIYKLINDNTLRNKIGKKAQAISVKLHINTIAHEWEKHIKSISK